MQQSGETSRKRPWLAALLAFLHPGLGHVYLREWVRALLWFGLMLTAFSLLVPESIIPTTVSFNSLRGLSRQLPLEAAVALMVITIMSTIDAYWMATRNNKQIRQTGDGEGTGTGTGERCPNCGRDIDPDIDFCHWCTTEIDSTNTDSSPQNGQE